jgi:hypothetical protein
MLMIASSFAGLFEALGALTLVLTGLALGSLVPAFRGRWWTWLLLVLPLFVGTYLVRDLVLYSEQLSPTLGLLYPLPLIFGSASGVLWVIRRRVR